MAGITKDADMLHWGIVMSMRKGGFSLSQLVKSPSIPLC